MNIRPIRTAEDHKAALARIDELMNAEAGTPEVVELEVLATLVQSYEVRMCPEDVQARLDSAYEKIADAYQVICYLLDKCGMFDADEGIRALDYFADPESPAEEDFCPWPRPPAATRE